MRNHSIVLRRPRACVWRSPTISRARITRLRSVMPAPPLSGLAEDRGRFPLHAWTVARSSSQTGDSGSSGDPPLMLTRAVDPPQPQSSPAAIRTMPTWAPSRTVDAHQRDRWSPRSSGRHLPCAVEAVREESVRGPRLPVTSGPQPPMQKASAVSGSGLDLRFRLCVGHAAPEHTGGEAGNQPGRHHRYRGGSEMRRRDRASPMQSSPERSLPSSTGSSKTIALGARNRGRRQCGRLARVGSPLIKQSHGDLPDRHHGLGTSARMSWCRVRQRSPRSGQPRSAVWGARPTLAVGLWPGVAALSSRTAQGTLKDHIC